MLKLLIYSYCAGVFSSRRIAKAIEENIALRVLAAGHSPSHRTLCRFRKEHIEEFEALFVQTDKIMIIGKGEVDLDTEKLDLEFATKPRSGVGISISGALTPFVKLKGTLAHPSMGLDKQGVLFSGGAAVATGGRPSFRPRGVTSTRCRATRASTSFSTGDR